MRIFSKPALLMLLLAACGLAFYAFRAAPARVETLVHESMLEAGFQNFQYARSEKRFGAMRFTDITLDEDKFSTLQSLQIDYGWMGVLFRHKLKNLTFRNFKLAGTVDASGQVLISGWMPSAGTGDFPADTITLENARLDLLSDTLGGINFTLNAKAQRQDKNSMALSGTLQGHQSKINLNTKFSGEISANGNWAIALEIEGGKIDLGVVSANRLSGTSEIYGAGFAPVKFMAQLNAGAMNIAGLPWQGASASIEGSPAEFKTVMEGKSIGEQGLEMGATVIYAGVIKSLEGSVHMERFSELFHYLQEHKFLPQTESAPAFLDSLGDITISFAQTGALEGTEIRTYRYALRDEAKILDLAGDLKLDLENKSAAGNIFLSPIRMETLDQSPQKDGVKGGNIAVTGFFESVFTPEDMNLSGKIEIALENLKYRMSALTFENINGTLTLNDLENWRSKEAASVTFFLPLKNTNYKGTGLLRILKGGQPVLENPAVEIFDGKISGSTINLMKNISEQPPQITLENIDLAQLTPALGVEDLYLAGRVNGTLPLAHGSTGLYIRGGFIKSATPGTIRFIPETPPEIFQGNDLYVETLRLGLENYHYTDGEVRLSGPLSGDITVDIETHGLNPELFEGRPLDITFTFKAPAATILGSMR